MTVRELGERMDASELMEWLAFDRVHTSEEWQQNALLRLLILQLFGDKKTRLDDLLPEREKAPREPRDPFATFIGWAKASGRLVDA
jgi:hypothetical protein